MKKIEGYWYNPRHDESYPVPIPNILTQEEADKIYDYLCRLEKRTRIRYCKGCTVSRITGETLGNSEYETAKWKWPGDFGDHYIKAHRVRPSDEFLRYIGYIE